MWLSAGPLEGEGEGRARGGARKRGAIFAGGVRHARWQPGRDESPPRILPQRDEP